MPASGTTLSSDQPQSRLASGERRGRIAITQLFETLSPLSYFTHYDSVQQTAVPVLVLVPGTYPVRTALRTGTYARGGSILPGALS